MALNTHSYRPIGGYNVEQAEDMLEDNQVRDCRNFLFESGEAFTRPGLSSVDFSGMSGTPQAARSFMIGSTPFTIVMTSDNKLWKVTTAGVATEITGAGITWGSAIYHNAEVVNGVIVVGNGTSFVYRWDTSGVVYTRIVAPYRYLVGHYSRLVGAYDTTGGAINPRKVAWSRTGDETNWTAPGGGSSDLTEIPDEITGLGNINNVLIIPRKEGIHLGFATGSGSAPFRFENWNRKGVGCYFPGTFAVGDNLALFVAKDDVYSFDLSDLSRCGRNIRKELFGYLDAGINYQGFISKKVGDFPRQRYVLAPQQADYPHFIYDIEEKGWSKQYYSGSVAGSFQWLKTNTSECIAILRATGISGWDTAVNCEEPAFLEGRTIVLGDPCDEAKVVKVLLRYRNFGETEITARAHLFQGENPISVEQMVKVGTPIADYTLRRKWLPLMVAGQDLHYELEIPAGSKFSMNYLGARYSQAGEFLGEVS